MMRSIAAVALALAAPLAAQTPPTTQDLNAATAAAVDARDAGQAAAQTAQMANESAEHRADRDAYMAALIAHDRAVDRANAHVARQQAAYADAMAAWRLQVAACRRGVTEACRAPTPNPADFY